jgi:CheY-like chemotaxis protein
MKRISEVDVVVVDYRLDDDDPSNQEGLELARQIRDVDPSLPIVGVSAYSQTEEVLSSGLFDEFYEKGGPKARRLHQNVHRIFALSQRVRPPTSRTVAEPYEDISVTIRGVTLALSEMSAITVSWTATNARRLLLIDRKLTNAISPEELAEFENLQRLAGARRRLAMPLPMKELQEIERALKKEKFWKT